MGITLAAFRIAGKIPLENYKRWFDICSWIRHKTLVGILLGLQDLLVMKDVLSIFSYYERIIDF